MTDLNDLAPEYSGELRRTTSTTAARSPVRRSRWDGEQRHRPGDSLPDEDGQVA